MGTNIGFYSCFDVENIDKKILDTQLVKYYNTNYFKDINKLNIFDNL